MSDLASRECVPCRSDIPPLEGEELQALFADLGKGWELVDERRLVKTYRFPNFQQALDFTNRIGALAEEVNHHPNISLGWGRVEVEIWTHKIGGLHEADFVWAAKADALEHV